MGTEEGSTERLPQAGSQVVAMGSFLGIWTEIDGDPEMDYSLIF